MAARFHKLRSPRALVLAAILMILLTFATPTNAYAGSELNTTNRYPGEGTRPKCQCGW